MLDRADVVALLGLAQCGLEHFRVTVLLFCQFVGALFEFLFNRLSHLLQDGREQVGQSQAVFDGRLNLVLRLPNHVGIAHKLCEDVGLLLLARGSGVGFFGG